MNLKTLSEKKILGVPVLYLIAALVLAFAIFAWRLKASPDTSGEPEEPIATDDITDGNALAGTDNPYAGLGTNGTVIVQQVEKDPDDVPEEPKTNERWVREGAEWLVATKNVSGTLAFAALNKYVLGQDRSFDENELVNAVIKEKGLPPDAIGEGGNVATRPLQKQFPNPPGVHVTVGSENLAAIAKLYYGVGDVERRDILQAANAAQLGIFEGPFPTGTRINVPAYRPPKYYVTPKANMTKAQIAAANGISTEVLRALNNSSTYDAATYFPKGKRFRVQ